MPDAGVLTLEEQLNEEYPFGPSAPLVAEWRGLRSAGQEAGRWVDLAGAAVQRWELKAEMLRDFQLTLPREAAPSDESRREDQAWWRELDRAERARFLRRVVMLGLWRR